MRKMGAVESEGWDCDDGIVNGDGNILESEAIVRAVRRGDKLIGRINVWGSLLWGNLYRADQQL